MSPADPRPLIAHVVYRFDIGGLENVIASLIDWLPTYRHAVVALTEVTAFRERIARRDVEYIALGKAPGHAVRLYPALYRYFRRARPAVVHTCNLAALEAAVPAWLARVPVRVHAEHGWDVHDRDGSSRKYRHIRRLYRPFVSRYVTVSPHIVEYLTRGVGISEADVSLIFNGVDTDRYAPAAGGSAAVPFDGGAWVVGTVGRMQAIKNQTLLARSFVRALQIEPRAADSMRLAMIGDGPLRSVAAAILAEAGVHHLAWLPGARDDVAAIMRGLGCFVLPSLAEGTSCTIQEAMASGLPIVATAVGGNADLVTEGVTGTLVPSGDVDAMAHAILRYWGDRTLAARHAAAARARVAEAFSIRAMADAYDRLFSRLLAQRAPQLAPGAA
ncbi:MAG TPA: TIGR03088 family PEP-CTERM/XrtA system glycosyltransferase [Burkholderiales bacterium]|nr:TIGR03088 family PEP-CTERM/XrtA system glycosyltransferase [Burkholderiales bacterium]